MKTTLSITTVFLSGIVAGIIIIFLLSFDRPTKEQQFVFKKNDPEIRWTIPPLPQQMNFAGEKVPLNKWEVKELLDREILFNYYNPGNILYMLKLSGRYFPLIESRLKAHGLPDDFKYLCIAESNMTNAVSSAGAAGFWQFMKDTAPGYEIEVNSNVDERYDVLKSTDAACVYLKNAFQKFGSWTAAAASYNCGMNGYQRQSEFQQSKNYYDLLLPAETQRYIFRILAFKYLMTNAGELGYHLPENERYTPVATRSITVTSSIPDLAEFARSNGSNYKMLKWHNPWLRSKELKVAPGKAYVIKLPAN